jgi:hypothetical protein
MDEIAKAAKYLLKHGGYVGIALGDTAFAFKVQEVCGAGETQACQKIRFTETGGFSGRWVVERSRWLSLVLQ